MWRVQPFHPPVESLMMYVLISSEALWRDKFQIKHPQSRRPPLWQCHLE